MRTANFSTALRDTLRAAVPTLVTACLAFVLIIGPLVAQETAGDSGPEAPPQESAASQSSNKPQEQEKAAKAAEKSAEQTSREVQQAVKRTAQKRRRAEGAGESENGRQATGQGCRCAAD